MEQLFLYFSIILVSCIALGQGANWLVDSAARLARKYGISDLVIGLTIVAFGTSAPEFAVTIAGAISGSDNVSVANVVGSNIFNIGFILGCCALLSPLAVSPTLIKRDGLILLAISAVSAFMLRDLSLTRIEGIVLFTTLLGYLTWLIVKKDTTLVEDDEIPHKPARTSDWFLLAFALLTIVAGGNALVFGAVELARYFGMSEWVIGMTVVAAGTSMPEMVVSIAAVIKKNHGISIGNLIGSNLFNTLGVLGVAVMISPMTVDKAAYITAALLVPLTALVVFCMWTHRRIGRIEGLLILLTGLAIMTWNILASSPK